MGDQHQKRFAANDVRLLRDMAIERGLADAAVAKKLSKKELVAALASDEATRFSSRAKWTRTLEDPPYAHIVEVVSWQRLASPALRAVVFEYPGAQDSLRVEVLGWHPLHDDGIAVEADVELIHDAINTVRKLRWDDGKLVFKIDDEEGDGEERSVDLSDWSVFTKPSIKVKKPRRR